jgi:hypothetical protein
MATSSSAIQSVISGIVLVGFYGLVLWRIAKRNAGNKVIEVGSLALMVVFIMVAAIKIPNLPDWVVPSLGILFLILGVVMILFLLEQGYNAIRRRKQDR